MPTYIFKNKKSDEVFEVQMRISELDEYKKKNPRLLQVPTAPSFRLKGSGWYETDFKSGKKKNVSGSEDKGGGEAGTKKESSGSDSGSKSDSKSSTNSDKSSSKSSNASKSSNDK